VPWRSLEKICGLTKIPPTTGINDRGDGDKSPQEFGMGGTLMKIVPQILSYFTISNTRLLAWTTNTAQNSQKNMPFQGKISVFFLRRGLQPRIHKKHAISRKNFRFFSGEGPSPLPTPQPSPQPSLLDPPQHTTDRLRLCHQLTPRRRHAATFVPATWQQYCQEDDESKQRRHH